MLTVDVAVFGHPDSDTAERASLTRDLLRVLDEAPAVHAVDSETIEAPPGAKGVGLDVASLVVTMVSALPGLLAIVNTWRDRNRGCRVIVELDGDRLDLADATNEQQTALVEQWLARHQ
jgi:NADPH-dependent ferric siderophore reductase